MKFTKDLLKRVSDRLELNSNESDNYAQILEYNWFDCSSVFRSAKIAMLERLNIPPEIALVIIDEANKDNKVVEEKTKDDTYGSYNYQFGTVNSNYDYSNHQNLMPFFADTDENSLETESKKDPIDEFLNQFVKYQKNTESRDASLKKLKFIIVRIINNPGIKDFHKLNTRDIELQRLIFNFVALANLLTYLGFELDLQEHLVFDFNKENESKISSCLAKINELRSKKTPHVPLREESLEDSVENRIKKGLETIDQQFKKILQPKVSLTDKNSEELLELNRVLNTKTTKLKLLEHRIGPIQKSVLEIKIDADLTYEEVILQRKFETLKIKQLKVISEIEELNKNINILEKKIAGVSESEKMTSTQITDENEVPKSELITKSMEARKETMLKAKTYFEKMGFDSNLSPEEESLSTFKDFKKQAFSEYDQLKTDFSNLLFRKRSLADDFERLQSYVEDNTVTFNIKGKGIDLLKISINSAEKVEMIWKIIELKLGFLKTEVDLVWPETKDNFKLYCDSEYIFNSDFITIENLELIEKKGEVENEMGEIFIEPIFGDEVQCEPNVKDNRQSADYENFI